MFDSFENPNKSPLNQEMLMEIRSRIGELPGFRLPTAEEAAAAVAELYYDKTEGEQKEIAMAYLRSEEHDAELADAEAGFGESA
jgi:hypothetical protein